MFLFEKKGKRKKEKGKRKKEEKKTAHHGYHHFTFGMKPVDVHLIG
jgi:hypothetical protein